MELQKRCAQKSESNEHLENIENVEKEVIATIHVLKDKKHVKKRIVVKQTKENGKA